MGKMFLKDSRNLILQLNESKKVYRRYEYRSLWRVSTTSERLPSYWYLPHRNHFSKTLSTVYPSTVYPEIYFKPRLFIHGSPIYLIRYVNVLTVKFSTVTHAPLSVLMINPILLINQYLKSDLFCAIPDLW